MHVPFYCAIKWNINGPLQLFLVSVKIVHFGKKYRVCLSSVEFLRMSPSVSNYLRGVKMSRRDASQKRGHFFFTQKNDCTLDHEGLKFVAFKKYCKYLSKVKRTLARANDKTLVKVLVVVADNKTALYAATPLSP